MPSVRQRPSELPGLALDRLERWLPHGAPEIRGPVTAEMLSAGRSNLTYVLTDADARRWVLRRPPVGASAQTHDVLREYGIVAALADTAIPTAPAVAQCADSEVLDAPFYLVALVDGIAPTSPEAARQIPEPSRARTGTAMVEALVALHGLDVDAVGLGGMRRPRGLVERQLKRWRAQLDRYDTPSVAELVALHDRLAADPPAAQRECLVHGDFKLANMIVAPDGELAAVLDWELAAVGDPLLDLAWLLVSWTAPGDDRTWITEPPTRAGGFPAPDELIAAYARGSGLDVGDLGYYLAFAYWRWSCINEGIRARFTSGAMVGRSVDLDALATQIAWQSDVAHHVLAQRHSNREEPAWT